MQRFIQYGEERIVFDICFLPRPLRRIAIHIDPSGAVQVDAPEGATASEVIAAVRLRGRWIWQRLREQCDRSRHVLPREYVSGETHFYLGKRYQLKVLLDRSAPQSVKLLGGRLEIVTHSKEAGQLRGLLEGWYRQRAEEVFGRRLQECASGLRWLQQLHPALPAFRLRSMRTRWGSCSPKGELVLNPQLVKAPRHCIDYVIFHELCHLKEHNHSPQYYRLLLRVLPDWEQRKMALDSLAEMLLNR
jgi:predicted metal-dependent hydrolase